MNKLRLLILLLASVAVSANAQHLYEIDASDGLDDPETGLFRMGDPGPKGKEIQVNSRYLTRGGEPMLPIMGEIHFSRVRRDQWKDAILKMKASGVNIVATYLFWNQHEEIEGHFCWEGEKDIRAFVKLCAAHGLMVYPRLGPWSHGEARNGGTPDWMLRKSYVKVRSNDQVNQTYVNRYFKEIEMPGHALAALASYPWLGCTGGPYQVKESWGAGQDVFCAGKESTYQFLEDVLEEVMEVFPSWYIHVGGDECPKERWEQCIACQERIRSEGLFGEEELQSYLIERMEQFIRSRGRTLIGWDEILEGGITTDAVVMAWRGDAKQGCLDAVRTGHHVILSPSYGFYLDYPQTSSEDSLAADWGGVTSLRKTYSYEPFNDQLKEDEKAYILGGQANIWTEYINNEAKAEYMTFPRLSAVSEVLWTPAAGRNWEEFKQRLESQYQRYRFWGIRYNPAHPDLE